MPAKVKRIHIGMPKAELEALLGEADYSPTDGQYYFTIVKHRAAGLC